MILPRWVKSTPRESNSRLYQPTAAPSDQAAVRDMVDGRQLLGQDHRIAHRHHQDAGAELDLRGARRDRGEDDQRLVDREVRIHAEQDVVPGPDRTRSRAPPCARRSRSALRARHLRILREVPHRDAELGLSFLAHRCPLRTSVLRAIGNARRCLPLMARVERRSGSRSRSTASSLLGAAARRSRSSCRRAA